MQSFSAEDAHHIAETVLGLTQALINGLSANARNDALRFAREEVELQESRLRASLDSIRNFRATEQSVDPSASAALEIQLISSLESRLIDVNTRIAALRQTLDADAPSVNALRSNSSGLEAQTFGRRRARGLHALACGGVVEL